ncbi:MAG: hypothetical protein EA403_15140 [Spirochaetaceae bacterium]|nr:MAG: hypothetical protein EA403_15140 [Spirochaetaceae bacterium]
MNGLPRTARMLALATLCAALNLVAAVLAARFYLPLYLDSLFTITLTLSFGPIAGLIAATLTNVGLHLLNRTFIAFVLCHYLTVVLTDVYRRRAPPRGVGPYVLLGFVLGFGNGLLGSLISFVVFGGITGLHAVDDVTMALILGGQNLIAAVFSAGMLTNLVDKVVSAIVAGILFDALQRRYGSSMMGRERSRSGRLQWLRRREAPMVHHRSGLVKGTMKRPSPGDSPNT